MRYASGMIASVYIRDCHHAMDQEELPLTTHQLECLRRCARGISMRFESWKIVEPLLEGGYAEKSVAGVITVTARGKEYLRKRNYE